LLANFDPPSGDHPALLSHENVRELFHEFGHVLHKTLTTARYSSLSGSNVAGDFVETPSQIMENWAYEQEVLQAISGHYLDPQKKLPNGVINKIIEARTFDVGVRYTKQVFLASFDQKIHTDPQPNAEFIEQQLFSNIMGLPAVPESCLAANFGHLMEGYDASYYGYVWAEVLADDIFALFQKDGILNSKLGLRYRQTILAKGGSLEANALLQQFLGRSPSDQAFFRKLGLESN
jgi:thimet oligopeptidase